MTPDQNLALRLCTYCPKLCRFSCPVSEATGKETLTPWGKMSSLARTLSRREHPSPAAALVPYACTGCQRCQEYCQHGVDVSASLFSGRGRSVKAGLSPQGAREVLSSFERRAPALRTLLADWPREGGWRYHPGCSALSAPETVEDTRVVLKTLAPGEVGALEDAACCGYPLYAAGFEERFRDHARRVGEALKEKKLVVGDPGCAYTFRVLYPAQGAEAPKEVKTLPEKIAPLLPARAASPTPRPRYHDACHLGRRLGVFEEPRRALAWAAGEAPEELPQSHKDAPCSGGGGLLPQTDPTTASAIARDALALADESPNNAPLVTACPTARKMLARAGADAFDWISWIRKALG